ncbi:MAG: DUF2298 domain-containing protein, partial [Chloroflexota bacterium]
GNFEMVFVEIPYQTRSVDSDYLRFWNLNDRQVVRPGEGGTDLNQWDFWWWWHGARVISDRNLDGNHTEVIDEFPQFSFLLSDNHPHVLALPFAVMALGLALNTLLRGRKPNRYEIIFYAICFGGLIFLNTWDGPIYLILLLAAEGLRRVIASPNGRLRWGDWRGLALLGIQLFALAAVFYLPFLVAFRSQAAGIAPNLLNPTMPGQFFLVFGPFILLVAPFLALEAWRAGRRISWGLGVKIGLLILGGLILLMLALAALGVLVPDIRAQVEQIALQNGGWTTTIFSAFAKRIAYFPTALLLTIGLILIAGRIFPRRQSSDPLDTSNESPVNYAPETGFALLLVAAALVLTLVPEFVYLRDNFGARMNTIFKFYYQAWLMLSIGGAYGIYSLLSGVRVPSLGLRAAYAALVVVVTGAGLLYPLMGVQSRMFYEDHSASQPLTLDGGGSISGADDYVAASCLGSQVNGTDAVVVSAVGGSYNWPSGAISTYTGIPTVFNWPGHEGQWRGSTYNAIAGTRESDVDRLYRDPTWNTARSIIEKYGIEYVVFGAKERTVYDTSSEGKFLDNLDIACESGTTRIFHVPESVLVADAGSDTVGQ